MKKQLLSFTLAALMLTGCTSGGSSFSSAVIDTAVQTETGTSASAKKERQIITVTFIHTGRFAGLMQPDLFVDRFNRSQSDYEVKIVNYWQYNSEYDLHCEGAFRQLKLDIVSGDAPDIVVLSDHSVVELLGKKGSLTDLNEFLDDDPEVNRDTLMPNVLTALESEDGSLYSIAPQFQIETMAVKKKFGQRENWTVKEMMYLYDNAPAAADHLYDGISRDSMFDAILCSMDHIVDYENAECYFDSDEFVDVLEFCNRFVEKTDEPATQQDDPYGTYHADKATWLKNDRSLVEMFTIWGEHNVDMNDFCKVRDTDFGDDITLVGYPSSSGHGGKLSLLDEFVIPNTCSDKKGAWQFVRHFLTEEIQAVPEEIVEPGAPIHEVRYLRTRKDCFEDWLDTCRYFIDWSDEQQAFVKVYQLGKNNETAHPLTDEEINDLRRYILSCDTLYDGLDSEIISICKEEAAVYFAGDCTAKQAADYIQNRCSILVSERS